VFYIVLGGLPGCCFLTSAAQSSDSHLNARRVSPVSHTACPSSRIRFPTRKRQHCRDSRDSLGTVLSETVATTSPPSTQFLLSFTFSFFHFLLHLFSCLSIPSHSTRIVPLHFQTGCRRRRLNPALVFCVCWFYIICIFQLKMQKMHARFVIFDDLIVIFPCYRR